MVFIFVELIYLKQASLTILIFETKLLLCPSNKYFGEIAKAALKDISSLFDFSTTSKKHFQLLTVTTPGQAKQVPIKIPATKKIRFFIN